MDALNACSSVRRKAEWCCEVFCGRSSEALPAPSLLLYHVPHLHLLEPVSPARLHRPTRVVRRTHAYEFLDHALITHANHDAAVGGFEAALERQVAGREARKC